MLFSVRLAVCAAAANALASVRQRKAARSAPPRQAAGLRLLWAELHRPAFLGGTGCLIASPGDAHAG
jgi:hypothetical protein